MELMSHKCVENSNAFAESYFCILLDCCVFPWFDFLCMYVKVTVSCLFFVCFDIFNHSLALISLIMVCSGLLQARSGNVNHLL